MDLQQRIDAFLDGETFAVVGASADRQKYGNKVLRCYQQASRQVYPVNPRGGEIEGLEAYTKLSELPVRVHGISVITPPAVTEQVVSEAAALGIGHIWMQPGAESAQAVSAAESAGISVIGGEACVLVVLGFRETNSG